MSKSSRRETLVAFVTPSMPVAMVIALPRSCIAPARPDGARRIIVHDSPAPLRQELGLRKLAHVEALHRIAEPFADLQQDVGAVEVRHRLDDRPRARLGIGGLED